MPICRADTDAFQSFPPADQIFRIGEEKVNIGDKVMIGTEGAIAVYVDASKAQKE